jgi:hypothetical protein
MPLSSPRPPGISPVTSSYEVVRAPVAGSTARRNAPVAATAASGRTCASHHRYAAGGWTGTRSTRSASSRRRSDGFVRMGLDRGIHGEKRFAKSRVGENRRTQRPWPRPWEGVHPSRRWMQGEGADGPLVRGELTSSDRRRLMFTGDGSRLLIGHETSRQSSSRTADTPARSRSASAAGPPAAFAATALTVDISTRLRRSSASPFGRAAVEHARRSLAARVWATSKAVSLNNGRLTRRARRDRLRDPRRAYRRTKA